MERSVLHPPGMGESGENITIHTKKFYRVILESIDTEAETPESFAIKLSSRFRVPIARAKIVARCLPHTAKSGLKAEQANRLKTILEEIGGRTRVEPHFVTPSDSHRRGGPAANRSGDGRAPIVCPECGEEQPAGATFCSLCLRKFRDSSSRPAGLDELLPRENPLEIVATNGGIDRLAPIRFVRRRPILVIAALILVLVVVVLLK